MTEEELGAVAHGGEYAAGGMRRLLCAVVLQALTDAQRGDCAAAYWLEHIGASWGPLLGLDPGHFGQWRPAAGRLVSVRRRMRRDARVTPEEQRAQARARWRAYYARQKTAKTLVDGPGRAQAEKP
jgi:hypothetical protein